MSAEVSALVSRTLEFGQVRDVIRSAATGIHAVGRLTAMQTITSVVDSLIGTPGEVDPFPSWAVAAVVMETVAAAVADRSVALD